MSSSIKPVKIIQNVLKLVTLFTNAGQLMDEARELESLANWRRRYCCYGWLSTHRESTSWFQKIFERPTYLSFICSIFRSMHSLYDTNCGTRCILKDLSTWALICDVALVFLLLPVASASTSANSTTGGEAASTQHCLTPHELPAAWTQTLHTNDERSCQPCSQLPSISLPQKHYPQNKPQHTSFHHCTRNRFRKDRSALSQ